jgi:hypothetical protein
MFGPHQRLGCVVGSNSRKEHGYGRSHCGHTPKVWYASIKVVGCEVKGKFGDGYVICNHPYFFPSQMSIQRCATEIYGKQQNTTK